MESCRIRRVIVYYYLEDDTMAVYETPYKNSALDQVRAFVRLAFAVQLISSRAHAFAAIGSLRTSGMSRTTGET